MKEIGEIKEIFLLVLSFPSFIPGGITMSKTKGSPPPKKSAGSGVQIGVAIGCLVIIGLTLVGLALAVLGVIPGFFGNDQTALSPSGLDDKTSPELLQARYEEETTQLNNYGWVDEPSGVVRIPISQAMVLVAERGLPVGVEDTPTPTPTPTVVVESESPAEETPVAEESPATPTPEGAGEPAPEETPPPEPTVNLAEVSFQAHVLPIFEEHCLQCHGGERPEGGVRTEEGLSLKAYEDIMAGSWNGSVIEPGDVENSYLIEQVVTGRMPKQGPKLTPEEIAILTAWVEAGAPNN
jgi:hypothetical protein